MARLADGTTIARQVSECHISLPQGEGHTPVILGEPGGEALLGVATLVGGAEPVAVPPPRAGRASRAGGTSPPR